MKFIDCAKMVVNESQCMLIRARKDSPGEYDYKEAFQGKKKGWVYLDGFTSSAVVQIHNALNDTNKIKFESLPAMKAIDVTWRLIKKVS